MFDVVNVDTVRRRLQKDFAAALRQGYCGYQDHDGDPHTDSWVGVETIGRLDEPDDECGNNDANVVDGITDNVDEYTKDTEIYTVFLGRGDDVHMRSMRRGKRSISNIDDAVVSVVVIMLMKEEYADDIQDQANAADDQD
jgi:hypothetical protein